MFWNDQNRYLVFLDPMYMARWDEALWKHWRVLATNPPSDAPTTIRATFGATYGVCTRDFGKLRRLLQNHPDARIVYEDDATYVFRVN